MWSEPRVVTLKKLWAEGLSASQIAKELGGVTRNAVIGKVHRLGLPYRATPSRPAKRSIPRTRAHLAPRRFRKAVEIKPAPAPIPDTLGPIDPSLTTYGLNAFTCRYPFGDPSVEGFTYCGRTCEGPYCAHHRAVVYKPSSAAELKAAERFAGWLDRNPRMPSGFAL